MLNLGYVGDTLTWRVFRELNLRILQPFPDVPVQAEGIRGWEVDGNIEFRGHPVHKLELLRMDYEDLGERRESSPPTNTR